MIKSAESEAFRKQLDEESELWVTSFNNGDADACAALYSEDVVALYPKMAPVRGRAELAKAYQALMDIGVKFTRITTEQCETDGRVGYAIQTAYSNRGGVPALLTFRKDESGKWLACCEAVPDAASS